MNSKRIELKYYYSDDGYKSFSMPKSMYSRRELLKVLDEYEHLLIE